MSPSQSYDRILPSYDGEESPDLTEQHSSFSYADDIPLSPLEKPNRRASLEIDFESHGKSSVLASPRLSTLRVRRKPVPLSYKGSFYSLASDDLRFAAPRDGWWKNQMLIDRSFMAMTALMVLIAIVLVSICASNLKPFLTRANVHSSAVGIKDQSCARVEKINTFVHLLINIAATMVLGMSNTFQQLVTSLKISELRWVLSKHGDSRIGVNNPFSINKKREGKLASWAAWLLLISTSVPFHFLSNSLVGLSKVVAAPETVILHPMHNSTFDRALHTYPDWSSYSRLADPRDFTCWSSFRTGSSHYPSDFNYMEANISQTNGNPPSFKIISVKYLSENCSKYANSTTDLDLVASEIYVSTNWYIDGYQTRNNCRMGMEVFCLVIDLKPETCRLTVRMQAAFILTGCAIIKATYMVTVVFRARGRTKDRCLVFGDAITASALDPTLRIKNECMVNIGDACRREVNHTCHKHCKDPRPSKTGDGIGHCQTCTKFNQVEKASGLIQPAIATKYKRPLLGSLGHAALTQIIVLMFCAVAMFSITLYTFQAVITDVNRELKSCRYDAAHNIMVDEGCSDSQSQRWARHSGGWGSFSTGIMLGQLQPDSLGMEFVANCISNGAQFIYSLLYILLIYNVTLISQESEWGGFETKRRRVRTTLVTGKAFKDSYLFQLPARVIFPLMAMATLMHWLLSTSISSPEIIWRDAHPGYRTLEHSLYLVKIACYPIWLSSLIMVGMTSGCWWAYTYKREGFIPQMFGSLRVLCASTSGLDDFTSGGVRWGDLGTGKQFRRAGLFSGPIADIQPNELYA